MTHIIVVIPGIMGSVLELNGEQVWPGPASSLVFKYKKMKELLSDKLDATDIIRSFSVSEQYGQLIGDLEACGFSEQDKTLYVCPYDWRKSNAISAEAVAMKIDDAHFNHGDAMEISLIAHSMGGLVARYYLESGHFKSRSGFTAVRRLITLGTPHRGAPLALTAALGRKKQLFLNEDQVKQLASDSRFPSLYQMLPPPDEPFVWDRTKGTEFRPVDIYDKEVAKELGLVPENLKQAREFQAKLNLSNKPSQLRYFCFAGTREKTLSYVQLLKHGDKYRLNKAEELKDAGDGTVPSWSGRLPSTQGEPVGGEHGTIYKTDRLRRTLGVLLGKEGVLAAAIRELELILHDPVVHPETPVSITLSFPQTLDDVDGHLFFEKADIGTDGTVTGFKPFGAPTAVRYHGPPAEKLTVTIDAPQYRGIYQIGFKFQSEDEPADRIELFVQEPN